VLGRVEVEAAAEAREKAAVHAEDVVQRRVEPGDVEPADPGHAVRLHPPGREIALAVHRRGDAADGGGVVAVDLHVEAVQVVDVELGRQVRQHAIAAEDLEARRVVDFQIVVVGELLEGVGRAAADVPSMPCVVGAVRLGRNGGAREHCDESEQPERLASHDDRPPRASSARSGAGPDHRDPRVRARRTPPIAERLRAKSPCGTPR